MCSSLKDEDIFSMHASLLQIHCIWIILYGVNYFMKNVARKYGKSFEPQNFESGI